jgi:hypothetical protein
VGGASEDDAPNPFANAERPPEGDHSSDVIGLDDIRALMATCKGRAFELRPWRLSRR